MLHVQYMTVINNPLPISIDHVLRDYDKFTQSL